MEQIGKYIVVEEIGRGGMGCVYRARDPVIEREVAIKVILERALDVPEIRERFYREARSAGRLAHDNIVVVHDVGEADDLPFIVMEFLEGTDLREAMDRAELPVERKLEIVLAICEGLRYAHERGVIHRDIKPENIRLVRGSRVKIVDFGIARLESGTQTLTHASIGTPRYMSPEQIKGGAVDHRTDIFSFGVLLYELVTGNLPFQGEHVTTLIYKILHEVPEPIELDDSRLTGQLQQIVSKCLEKNADERYSDFGEVIQDLNEVVADLQTTRTLPYRTVTVVDRGRPPARKGKKTAARRSSWGGMRVAVAVIGLLVVVGGAFAVVFWENAPWNSTILAQSVSSVEAPEESSDAPPQKPETEAANGGLVVEEARSSDREDQPAEEAQPLQRAESTAERQSETSPAAAAPPRQELDDGPQEQAASDAAADDVDAKPAEDSAAEAPSEELRAAAEQAHASMLAVKSTVPQSVVDSRSYQRGLGFEDEGSQAYESGDFERASDRFTLAEGSYAEAGAPELVVQTEARAIQEQLKRAILNEEWSAVPKLVHDGYAKHVADLRKHWRITDVTISDQPPRIDPSAAVLPVTVTIHYVQPGGFDPGNYSLFFDWTWMKDDSVLRLAQVQLIRTSQ